jgi:hypothetical protein
MLKKKRKLKLLKKITLSLKSQSSQTKMLLSMDKEILKLRKLKMLKNF